MKQKSKPFSIQIRRCSCCLCWFHASDPGKGLGMPEIWLPAHIRMKANGKDFGVLIARKTKPRGKESLFLKVGKEGTIEYIAGSPCLPWRKYILRHYKKGVRYLEVRFDKVPTE